MNPVGSFPPALVPLDVPAPHLEYGLLSPLLVVLIGAFLGVLFEAFLPRHHRRDAQALLAGLAVVVALVMVAVNWYRGYRQVAALGSVVVDGPTLAAWAGLLVFGGLSLVLFAERRHAAGQSSFVPMAAATPGSPLERDAIQARLEHTEVFPLVLFALFGMMLLCASGDLLTMFVALEVFSLPLYLLCGLARRRRLLSQEAALKYFLLGALSSALFLYGVALLYGYAGTFGLAGIDTAVSAGRQNTTVLVAGMGLVSIGLLFKMGAVPFHSWTPDVYQGAPTPVSAFMAICTKLAAAVALMRVLYAGLGAMRWDWQPLVATIAVLTMLVGAIVSTSQADIKRFLAYSSITHAGFILIGVTSALTGVNGLRVGQIGGVAAVLFYLAAYGFATVGAFALVLLVRGAGGEANGIVSWRGLGRRHPLVAGTMTLFLCSFAGIPLTSGFVGKLTVFVAAWRGGYAWLVLVGVLASIIAATVYLRLVVLMWFTDVVDAQVEVARPGVQTAAVVAVCALLTVALGVFPAPLLDLLVNAAGFLR